MDSTGPCTGWTTAGSPRCWLHTSARDGAATTTLASGGLEGADARRLLSLLPRLARGDRQNNAPTIATLLRAAASVDGLTLEGYVIRAPRRDERVSIDTVCVPESAISAITGSLAPEQACPSYLHWLALARVLAVPADAPAPDEIRFLTRAGSSERWWWAWWD